MNKAEYYVENQRGVNPHDRLSPSMSALISVAACFPTATFPRIRCFTMVAVTHEQSARAKRVAGRAAAERDCV